MPAIESYGEIKDTQFHDSESVKDESVDSDKTVRMG
jgi:hypothetical protein